VTPAWLDTRAYPFQSRGVDIEGARVHYIDEGQGPTVVELSDAGHAPQETRGPEVVSVVARFLDAGRT